MSIDHLTAMASGLGRLKLRRSISTEVDQVDAIGQEDQPGTKPTGLEARREAEKRARNVRRKARAITKPAQLGVRCDERVRELVVAMAADGATLSDVVVEAILALAESRKVPGARDLADELMGGE